MFMRNQSRGEGGAPGEAHGDLADDFGLGVLLLVQPLLQLPRALLFALLQDALRAGIRTRSFDILALMLDPFTVRTHHSVGGSTALLLPSSSQNPWSPFGRRKR